MRRLWHLWAKALGPKQGATDQEADLVAGIRTMILVAYMVTNGFIIASSWRNLIRPPGIEPGSAAYKATALTNKQRPQCHCMSMDYVCNIQKTAP